jgi:limonene-1,2-epoxide hydrolase
MSDTRLDRRLFGAAALAGTAALLLPRDAAAQQLSAEEQANVKLVNDFCAAFASKDMAKIVSFMANDVTYRMTETTPAVTGHDGINTRLKDFVESSKTVEFKVLDSYAKGPMVVNHRIDTFAGGPRSLIWEGVGVFLVKDGKIREWHDYTIKVSR